MKIKVNSGSNYTRYRDLCCGDTFTIREGGYYMVVDYSDKDSDSLYCVDLEDGALYPMQQDAIVFPVRGYFGIEG